MFEETQTTTSYGFIYILLILFAAGGIIYYIYKNRNLISGDKNNVVTNASGNTNNSKPINVNVTQHQISPKDSSEVVQLKTDYNKLQTEFNEYKAKFPQAPNGGGTGGGTGGGAGGGAGGEIAPIVASVDNTTPPKEEEEAFVITHSEEYADNNTVQAIDKLVKDLDHYRSDYTNYITDTKIGENILNVSSSHVVNEFLGIR